MNFNDILVSGGIEPNSVLLMRHSPKEPELRRVLPWLAEDRHHIYNAYQQTQSPRTESQMLRADYIASFIGTETGRALFVGLYRRGGSRPLNHQAFWTIPENKDLHMLGMEGHKPSDPDCLWIELQAVETFAHWKGRVVTDFPRDRNWTRWADKWPLKLMAIHEHSVLTAEMPSWDRFVVGHGELANLPARWRAALAEWRGIYAIIDETDGKLYVGSAYGEQNIYGRWSNYALTGHGNNAELVGRDPSRFRYSILQRLSPDLESSEVIRIEQSWKERLHTREFGLNRN